MKRTFVILAVMLVSTAYGQTLSWQAPTERTDGTAIEASETMFYTLYYNTGSGRFRLSTVVDDTEVDLSKVPPGCYNLRVTATFHSDPSLVSDPSDELYYCVEDGAGTGDAESEAPPKSPVIKIEE